MRSAREVGIRPSINTAAILSYLARAGLVDAAATALPEIQISDLSRSHLVVSVRLGDGRHLIVKRARARPGELVGSLQRELVVYRLAAEHGALSAAMPTPLWTDPALQVLITEAVEPGVTLRANALQHGPPSTACAHSLGELIAGWHRRTEALSPAGRVDSDDLGTAGGWGLPAETPWVLGILTAGAWRPPVTERLLVHGQVRRELRAAFAALAESLEPSCLVHGDLKWDNCLIDSSRGIRVVDWEHAAIGDPAWDVAGILQDYLAVPRAAQPQDSWQDGAEASVGESVAAFLIAYLDSMAPKDRHPFAERAARLAGARLVQTALEHAAVAADDRLAAVLVEDAVRVLRDPRPLLAEGSTAR